ncbi:MAG TPA: hypothetical protein PKM60_06650 [Zoogloea sp.]|uniref:hypothetical protein n=1 Tax=Zoogloea sp. TaxID=49181 RepID=UPI002CF8A28F|nr:hypothetical protein [Zoogloea sp.]HOB45830.1 hypothetical protein [Zoogloea sp.]HQA10646.1 hypothetical protein [Zoogloea sp.]HQE39790.1 hypothetical protein [Zoogloea sp.]
MIAEDGITDYGFAKRKAARQLGAVNADELPNNAEIESEVRIYMAVFQDEEHIERQQVMRVAAVEVMRELEDFRPYLTGAVLEGTAGRYSEIEIDLFPESAKEVEIFFLNHSVAYDHREPRRNQPEAPEAILVFDWDDIPVKLRIYSPDVERLHRRGAHGARQMERARLSVVEALINETPATAGSPP